MVKLAAFLTITGVTLLADEAKTSTGLGGHLLGKKVHEGCANVLAIEDATVRITTSSSIRLEPTLLLLLLLLRRLGCFDSILFVTQLFLGDGALARRGTSFFGICHECNLGDNQTCLVHVVVVIKAFPERTNTTNSYTKELVSSSINGLL